MNWKLDLAEPMPLAGIERLWEHGDRIRIKTQTEIKDETAFREFYDRTAPALRSYLRMLCKDAALADDLLQESFFRFLRANVSDMNAFQMKAYLYKAANSAARDHWRAEKRRRRWDKVTLPENEQPDNISLSHDVNRIFRKLNQQQQMLLWLAYVEGFQHREIAKILKMKEKSVRVMLFRARKQLAGMLQNEGMGPKERS